jgi:hypothetical protein
MGTKISHYTEVSTSLKNKNYLKKALKRMGLEFTEGNFTITQYDKSSKAEIKFDNAVGLSQQKDGTWMMVGDFYHSNNHKLSCYYGNQNKFKQDIQTAYSIEETNDILESQGFSCVENTKGLVNKQGVVRLVYEQY